MLVVLPLYSRAGCCKNNMATDTIEQKDVFKNLQIDNINNENNYENQEGRAA
jgi:hypothetical protein